MKRKLALIISLFMLVTALFPVHSFAAEDKGLQSAITTAKALFDITDDYSDFDYSSNTYNGRTAWYLYWNWDDRGGINVVVDDRGTVISYDSYNYSDYGQKKLPKLTRVEAQKTAEDFLNKVNPGVLKQIKLDDIGISYLNDPYYYFRYYRVYNEIPFRDNTVNLTINKQTGKVQNYSYNWNDNLSFPDAEKKISLADAQKVYQEKLGLKLVYKSNNDRKNLKVYLAYVPVFNSDVCIDALTGEKLELYPSFYGGKGGGAADQAASFTKDIKEKDVTLSPEELKAIQEVTKLLTLDQAEAKARTIKQLELTNEYKVVRSGISRNWLYQKEYTWNLYFEKSSEDKNNERYYVDVTLDGVTGELEGFYRNYGPTDESSEVKYDRDAAKSAVDKFLKALMPNKYANLQFEENPGYETYSAAEVPRYYDFNYTRTVNGVPFVSNSATVGIDAVTGKILSFNINWNDVEFPSKNNVLTKEKAYENLFAKIGLKLQYKLKQSGQQYFKYGMDQSFTPEVALVYMLDDKKPAQLDANTGEITDFNGAVFNEVKPISYTDISGHFAENEIKTLAECGIGFAGTEFKPNDKIIQKDFLSLVSRVMGYISPSYTDDMTQDEVDKMYTCLLRDGIVKDGEKNPSAVVTREESIKFVIRALKYDKIAELPGIFTCKFADNADITPALYGYVTLGHALKLINGDTNNKFNPKNQLSRGEAASIIYRMLSIE